MTAQSEEVRSRIMRAVRQKNTAPEMRLRRAIHSMGGRYRLHVRKLPGSPDLVFPARKLAVFVHGCFWHGHTCRAGRPPKSRLDYWLPKLEANRARDLGKIDRLRALGWEVVVVWECELGSDLEVEKICRRLLKSYSPSSSDSASPQTRLSS